jgi:hypothetical protein
VLAKFKAQVMSSILFCDRLLIKLRVVVTRTFGLLASTVLFVPGLGQSQSLAPYYIAYLPKKYMVPPNIPSTDTPPQSRTIGGAPEPGEFSWYGPNDFSMSRYYLYAYFVERSALILSSPSNSPCLNAEAGTAPPLVFDGKTVAGDTVTQIGIAFKQGGPGPIPALCMGSDFGGTSFTYWRMTDVNHFGAPIRRRAIDGGAFDASPMTVIREGVPWMTYYWGYRLGMVESRSDWDDKNKGASTQFATWPAFPTPTQNFALTTLPPPFVEGEVTEYVNVKDFPKQPGGQYFYAATQGDRDALDAAPNWQRTQRSFNAGGYVNVCRFYGGGKPGGPNTHFFTADDTECARLKTLPFLDFEGTPFVADLPIPAANASQAATCRTGTRPLYRAYNNAYGPKGQNDWQSNHRFVTHKADITAMVAIGWADEGVAMCVPVVQ